MATGTQKKKKKKKKKKTIGVIERTDNHHFIQKLRAPFHLTAGRETVDEPLVGYGHNTHSADTSDEIQSNLTSSVTSNCPSSS